jgi:signal transduction histidine kinase
MNLGGDACSAVLSIVSHDIRAPLGVILVAVSELSGGQVGPINDEQRALLSLVRRSSERLGRLASNVLYLNRIARGGMSLARARVDLREIASRAYDGFVRSGEMAKLAAPLDLAPARVEVQADVDALGNAVINVIANAVRFAKSSVRVAVREEDERGVVTVEDDGPGFLPEVLPHLFEMARLGSEADPPVRGMGLVVAGAIVRAHGGEITAATMLGPDGKPSGARVRVFLPHTNG